ncbi:unnamed protein product [Rhizoctonia solani]|uniref:F-box domain-containing protein n=1 Tax=Rhizoctonia solani TaxID=456999 RepID=A0A8H3HFP9_9AGAM|nr:unnamed protein product [Rhizoctonia solani]
MEELESVGNQLQTVLDQYLGICAKMDDLSSREGVLRNVPQGYLNRIGTEIARFPSYHQALGWAEATVNRVRNRIPQLTPISSVPPEILTHIFHLVANPCDLLDSNYEDSDSSTSPSLSEYSDNDSSSSRPKRPRSKALRLENFPTHLDRLTHVCSYWRRVAIDSPSLWVHIDFFPHKTLSASLLIRAETYAARAAELPIELHVADDSPAVYQDAPLRQFLTSIRNRVKSLDIAVICRWKYFHQLVLNELFPDHLSDSQAGIFTKLTTSFPMAGDETDEFFDWFDDTNNSFLCLTVLHCRGLFPFWGSTAYNNLVDLRLTPASDTYWTRISERELRNILKTSPGLRIIHFGLYMSHRQRDDVSVKPAPLNDLEVVSISTDRGVHDPVLRPGDVLRLLAPGSKPLRLSIWHRYHKYYETANGNYDEFSVDELVRFFQRSNVTKFYTKGGFPGLNQLFGRASNLEDLAFDSCAILAGDADFPPPDIPTFPRLNSLIFRNCILRSPPLQAMLRVYPADQVILSACNLFRLGLPSFSRGPVAQVSTPLEGFPNTRLVVYDNQLFDPITKWELVD